MSDGNFNRNLLPYHNYQSGVRAGRASMRTTALKAFEEWLQDDQPDLSSGERAEKLHAFRQILTRE